MNRPIGLVLSGTAEIYETYVVDRLRSYRPIRLLEAGSIFGDFAVLDHHYPVLHDLGPYNGRRGETWKLCAGRKSILITNKVRNGDLFHCMESDVVEPHRLLDNSSNRCSTVIAFVSSDFVAREPDFLEDLVSYSWPRAKTYRDSLNSFNFTELLDFRRHALKRVDGLLRSRTSDKKSTLYSGGIGKKRLLPLFIDAVWDACNRPLRREPMFAAADDAATKALIEGTPNIGIQSDHLLVASHLQNEFWFPVDCSNYLLASYCAEEKALQDEITDVFGGRRKRDAGTIQRNPRTFFRDLCNELLQDMTSNPHYPFDVTCEDIEGIERRMTVLRFARRLAARP